MSFGDYCIWFWTICSQKKLNFFSNIFNVVYLTLKKTSIKSKYWIELMYIDKLLQGKGVGTELVQKYLRSVPVGSEIWVDTEKNNKAAIDFYEKNSFVTKHSVLSKNTFLMYKKI